MEEYRDYLREISGCVNRLDMLLNKEKQAFYQDNENNLKIARKCINTTMGLLGDLIEGLHTKYEDDKKHLLK